MRPITGRDELDLFCQFPYVLNAELAHDLETGRRRPEWMWLALRGDQLVARAAWWAPAGAPGPLLLDIFDIHDDTPGADDAGLQLLRTAMAEVVPAGGVRPEYGRYLPPDWLTDDQARRAMERRIAVLERTGAEVLVERLRLEWRPEAGVPERPERPERLSFRPVRGRHELIPMMTLVLDGTLDAHSLADLTRRSAEEVAVDQYRHELSKYQSPRDWWKVAVLPGGEPVRFVIPARNAYHPIIAYIGVLPAHRGNGYIDGLVAEGTRVLAGEGVPRIRASTDVGNHPMAAAFARAGYALFERQIDMVWT
jgi:RimJ/RimL family protein N-acetyltransferase